MRTLVIDKRDIGTGSTSASTAMLQYEIDVPLRELIRKVGPEAATRSYQLCRDAICKVGRLATRFNIKCGFEYKPSLFLAPYQREVTDFRKEYKLRRAMGLDLEFLEEADVRARFPFTRPAALYSKGGGQVDPHRLTYGLLAAGMRAGLEVCDRTEMTLLEHTSRGVRVTTKQGCQITARRVVIAAGFESKQLLQAEAGTLKSTYALISEPKPKVPGWDHECLIWDSGMPYLLSIASAAKTIRLQASYLQTTCDQRRDGRRGRPVQDFPAAQHQGPASLPSRWPTADAG